jgi:hypothetical protein
MGRSQTYLAVRGKSTEVVFSDLALRPTGEREEFPESPITAAQLPSNWFLVVLNRDAQDIARDKALRELSLGCEVIICIVEEHVMCSEASCWRDGRRLWRVSHDSVSGIEHIETEGEPPPAFATIRDRLAAEQQAAGGKKAGVDYYFDIPVELAKSFTGYDSDHDMPGLEGDAFEVLVSAQSKRESTNGGSFASDVRDQLPPDIREKQRIMVRAHNRRIMLAALVFFGVAYGATRFLFALSDWIGFTVLIVDLLAVFYAVFILIPRADARHSKRIGFLCPACGGTLYRQSSASSRSSLITRGTCPRCDHRFLPNAHS